MTTLVSESVTNSYYFNPYLQTYTTTKPMKEPSVCVKLTTPEELPTEKLANIIQRLGNYISVISVRRKSYETETNYCKNVEHASTCQTHWNHCKRHLTVEEIDECLEMELRLYPDSFLRPGVSIELNGLYMNRGELAQMRKILDCVRTAIQQL